MVEAEGLIFRCEGCDGTYTLGTEAVSETTLGYGAGWGEKTVDCRVNSDVNVGGGEGVVSGVSTYRGAGMAWLRIVAIFFNCILHIIPKLQVGGSRLEGIIGKQ